MKNIHSNIEKAKKCSWFDKVKYIPYDINNECNDNLYEIFHKPDKVIHLSWEGLPHYNDLVHIEKNLSNNYKFIKNFKYFFYVSIIFTNPSYHFIQPFRNSNFWRPIILSFYFRNI